jgi:hypothetical protein
MIADLLLQGVAIPWQIDAFDGRKTLVAFSVWTSTFWWSAFGIQ